MNGLVGSTWVCGLVATTPVGGMLYMTTLTYELDVNNLVSHSLHMPFHDHQYLSNAKQSH